MYNNVNVNHPLIHRENNYVSIKKNVSVHSDDRDRSKWPNANEFEIELPQPLKQVQYMKLTDINLPTELCNISSKYQNNKILFGKRESAATDTYSKHTLEIVSTNGCGKDAVVTAATITGGVVATIDVDGGSEYSAGDKILISIDDVELGYYTIVSTDINAGTRDFKAGNLTGTMPTNPNKIANAAYISTAFYTPVLITVPDGAYTHEQLASTIQTLANKDSVTNFKVNASVKGTIFISYNRPEKKFYAGTSENKEFALFFDEKSHNYILSQGGYGSCPQNNEQYYTKNMWGLGAILGFEKSNYYAQSITDDGMFNTPINNYNYLNSEITVVNTDDYQNSNAMKHVNVWLPLDTAGPGRELSSTITPYMFLPSSIYMEVDKYNNSDELIPNANNSSSYNISAKSTNATLAKETCNTSGQNDTLSYKRGMDSSNRTTNIKQRNAFSNQPSTTTVNYGGKINSYFAKLSTPDFSNSQYINISGDDIKTITLFSNQLEERIQKLKVKFRFHDGTLLDFGNSDINFTIEFGTILSDQEKDMKIRNIYR